MRHEFGIGARELLDEMPAWEIDVLVEKWNERQRELQRQSRKG